MTVPTPETASSLEDQLTSMYQMDGPEAHLTGRIDSRVAAALEENRTGSRRASRRPLLLAASASLMAVLVFAGGVVAQRLASDGDLTIIDGIVFSDDVVERPGITNIGQPFWGTDIFERTPSEAAAMASEKGYSIRWQIERHDGGASTDADIVFSDQAPPCGEITGGSILEANVIQMVVVMDDPSTPGSEC